MNSMKLIKLPLDNEYQYKTNEWQIYKNAQTYKHTIHYAN